MPPDFQYATLDEIMRNYVEALNGANGCELSYRSEPADADWGRIPTDKALGIYRIVQEAVGNALKHSEASHIAVVLQQQGNVVVTVADDGKKEMGEVNGASSNGIGLRTMHQRADAIGGRITMSNHGGIHLFTLEVEHEK